MCQESLRNQVTRIKTRPGPGSTQGPGAPIPAVSWVQEEAGLRTKGGGSATGVTATLSGNLFYDRKQASGLVAGGEEKTPRGGRDYSPSLHIAAEGSC